MRGRKNGSFVIGLAFIIMGAAVVAVCVFPSKWMVVVVALALVAAGILLLKC